MEIRNQVISVSLLSVMILTVLFSNVSRPAWGNQTEEYVPDELIVQAKSGVAKGKIDEILCAQGANTLHEIGPIRIRQIRVPDRALDKVKAALERNPHMSFVENNYYAAGGMEPNDVKYSQQWYLPKISAPLGWEICTGAQSIPIAIIDSGIDPIHPDLVGKILPGYNFLQDNADTRDVLGHGTAVAGTAAALSNNLEGITGVAWANPIMPLVVLNSENWATYYDIARAVVFAADQGVRIMNISIGGSSSSTTLQNAIDYAWNKGAMVFACAHNYSTSTPYYPAACTHAVAVSATDAADNRASFSNYGNWIDVAAPGVSILTTTRGGGYGSWSGTSFSSPIAAGLAALITSVNPSLTNYEILELITGNTDDLGALGFDQYFGFGRVNVNKSLNAASQVRPLPDTMKPTAVITAPPDGSTVTGPVRISVSAGDDRGVIAVELYINGTLFATSNTEPYDFLWDTESYPEGYYDLSAVAYDSSGNFGHSNTVAVQVSRQQDIEPPIVCILSPTDESYLSKSVKVTGTATDNTGVIRLELYIDGILRVVRNGGNLVWKWDTRAEKTGPHTISAVAYDQAENAGVDSITVYK